MAGQRQQRRKIDPGIKWLQYTEVINDDYGIRVSRCKLSRLVETIPAHEIDRQRVSCCSDVGSGSNWISRGGRN
jgi:hypothetical protein